MVALFRFSIWRLDVVVNMSKILNFLKLCLHQKDPYPWGIYETSLITQIYKRLGIAKSTYYAKLKEYNHNL